MGSQPVHSSGDDAVLRDVRKQAGLNPPLDAAEERRLLEMAARGDKASQERLVAANLALVVRLPEARDGKGISVPDLVQDASIRPVAALPPFPRTHPPASHPFAHHTVR